MRSVTEEDKRWINEKLFFAEPLASRDIVMVLTIALVIDKPVNEIGLALGVAQEEFKQVFNRRVSGEK